MERKIYLSILNNTEILKRNIDKKINKIVSHKSSLKATNDYINSLDNDKKIQ